MPDIKLVVTDLDNTVYDWLSFFIPSFRAMLEELRRITGVSRDDLLDSFRRVNQRHGTTEYAFAVEELDVLEAQDRRLSMLQRTAKYRSALAAFRHESARRLRPYPGVVDTLLALGQRGIRVVALSDSMLLYTGTRLRQLGIDTLFAALAAPHSHDLPAHVTVDDERSALHESLDCTAYCASLPCPLKCENPIRKRSGLFLSVLAFDRQRLYMSGTASLVMFFWRSGAAYLTFWAAYGQMTNADFYRDLLRITYWTEREIEAEDSISVICGSRRPSHAIGAYSDLLPLLGLASKFAKVRQ